MAQVLLGHERASFPSRGSEIQRPQGHRFWPFWHPGRSRTHSHAARTVSRSCGARCPKTDVPGVGRGKILCLVFIEMERQVIRRDIHPQWQNIVAWYWTQYHRKDHQCLSIWQVLERDHGAQRTRGMGQVGWSVVDFPDERAYTWFLLKWSGR